MMIDWREFAAGQHRITCLQCGRGPRDKTMGVTIDRDGGGVAHCFRCKSRHHRERASRKTSSNSPIRAVAASKRESLSEYGRDLYRACKRVSGAARQYLDARGCVIPPADGALRWHEALRHPAGSQHGPVLMALVTDAVTRLPLTLHRTWIRADGRKADVDPPRMLLAGHRKAGGVIRLWPDEAVTAGLGVAEGIETALSLAHAISPVWACVDAGNLAALPVLQGIEALTIAADADAAGRAAAHECAERWARAGVDVRIVEPPVGDLNDVVQSDV